MTTKPWGICDRTGFRYPLEDLVYEVQDGQRTGLRIGKDMVDPDHPQYRLGDLRLDDPKPLNDPRPDTSPDTGLHGWNPVWNAAQYAAARVGKVTTTIV